MNDDSLSTRPQHINEFAIIETDDGLTVVMLDRGLTAEETAARHNGLLVDPGPYKTFDDAYDAITNLMEYREEQD